MLYVIGLFWNEILDFFRCLSNNNQMTAVKQRSWNMFCTVNRVWLFYYLSVYMKQILYTQRHKISSNVYFIWPGWRPFWHLTQVVYNDVNSTYTKTQENILEWKRRKIHLWYVQFLNLALFNKHYWYYFFYLQFLFLFLIFFFVIASSLIWWDFLKKNIHFLHHLMFQTLQLI